VPSDFSWSGELALGLVRPGEEGVMITSLPPLGGQDWRMS